MEKGLRIIKRNSRYLTPLALLVVSALLPVACEPGSTPKYSHTHAERFAGAQRPHADD